MGGALLLSLHEVVGLPVGSVDAGHVENSLQQKDRQDMLLRNS